MVRYGLSLCLLAGTLTAGCTIKPPEVHVTSDKTALEYQLFGQQGKLSDDPATTASVWALYSMSDYESGQLDDLMSFHEEYYKRKIMLAQIRRKTTRENIDELKRYGLLGERSDGRIRAMSDTLKQADELSRIVTAENNDREIIWEFYARTHGLNSDEELESLKTDFAGIMARLSPSGTWIEDKEGKWYQK